MTKQEVEALIEKYTNNNTNKSTDINSSLNSDSIYLNMTYAEATSCEEYELVQNLFHKIIREIRRERENFLITSPLQISEESNSNNSQKSKSKFGNQMVSNNSKRAKSPKLNLNNIIQESFSKESVTAALNQSLNGSNSIIQPQQQNTNINNVNSSINIITSNKEAKKNSSKFPFFTKILNKS